MTINWDKLLTSKKRNKELYTFKCGMWSSKTIDCSSVKSAVEGIIEYLHTSRETYIEEFCSLNAKLDKLISHLDLTIINNEPGYYFEKKKKEQKKSIEEKIRELADEIGI
jgi:hypothetical protein